MMHLHVAEMSTSMLEEIEIEKMGEMQCDTVAVSPNKLVLKEADASGNPTHSFFTCEIRFAAAAAAVVVVVAYLSSSQ